MLRSLLSAAVAVCCFGTALPVPAQEPSRLPLLPPPPPAPPAEAVEEASPSLNRPPSTQAGLLAQPLESDRVPPPVPMPDDLPPQDAPDMRVPDVPRADDPGPEPLELVEPPPVPRAFPRPAAPERANGLDVELGRLERELQQLRTLREALAGTSELPHFGLIDSLRRERRLRNELMRLTVQVCAERPAPRRPPDDGRRIAPTLPPDDLPDVTEPFELGRLRFREGRFEEAEEHFRAVEPDAPNYLMARSLLAASLSRQGHVDEAAEILSEVADSDDAALRDAARQQLESLRIRRELEGRLREIRRLSPAPRPSLYERLGGAAAVRAVVEEFVDRAVENPDVDFTRGRPVPPGLTGQLVDWLGERTGGPQQYDGRSMREAHRGMGISNAEFDALLGELEATLRDNEVPAREVRELLEIVAATRQEIVEVE